MNTKLLTRIIKSFIIFLLLLLVFNSCSDESNPLVNEYRIGNTIDETPTPCCVYPPSDINIMMADQQEGNDLPWPMIVGGTQVNPACPDCKYEFMV